MKQPPFRFTDDQRSKLIRCWKRRIDHVSAEKFLNDAEWRISAWLQETKEQRTSAAGQIQHADSLHQAADRLLEELNKLPRDVAKNLNTYFIRAAHGEDWFRQHREACEADRKHSIECAISDGLSGGFAGKEPPPRMTEYSKLPPDLLQTLNITQDWLAALSNAAEEMQNTIKGAKQWQDKELEWSLMFSLAIGYKSAFGKAPSPTNGSVFRKLAIELSTVLHCTFGADVVRNACDSLKLLNRGD